MSFVSSRVWACRQTARAIFQYKGLFGMALSLAGLALTIPFFLGTLALSLSNPIFDVPTHTEMTIFADRSAGKYYNSGSSCPGGHQDSDPRFTDRNE